MPKRLLTALLLAACSAHTVEATRSEVQRVPADGRVDLLRADDGGRREARIRRIEPVPCPLGTDCPADLPADDEAWQTTKDAWLADPTWDRARVELQVFEPAALAWTSGGAVTGGALGAVIGYEAASCDPRRTHSCEDAGTIQGFTTFLSAALGMALGAAAGGALHVATRPDYRWADAPP